MKYIYQSGLNEGKEINPKAVELITFLIGYGNDNSIWSNDHDVLLEALSDIFNKIDKLPKKNILSSNSFEERLKLENITAITYDISNPGLHPEENKKMYDAFRQINE